MCVMWLGHFDHFDAINWTCYCPRFTFVSNKIRTSPVGCFVGFPVGEKGRKWISFPINKFFFWRLTYLVRIWLHWQWETLTRVLIWWTALQVCSLQLKSSYLLAKLKNYVTHNQNLKSTVTNDKIKHHHWQIVFKCGFEFFWSNFICIYGNLNCIEIKNWAQTVELKFLNRKEKVNEWIVVVYLSDRLRFETQEWFGFVIRTRVSPLIILVMARARHLSRK